MDADTLSGTEAIGMLAGRHPVSSTVWPKRSRERVGRGCPWSRGDERENITSCSRSSSTARSSRSQSRSLFAPRVTMPTPLRYRFRANVDELVASIPLRAPATLGRTIRPKQAGHPFAEVQPLLIRQSPAMNSWPAWHRWRNQGRHFQELQHGRLAPVLLRPLTGESFRRFVNECPL
jgi:hypothetical protein